MRGNRRKDTRPEIAVRRCLHALGARFRVDLPLRAGSVLVRPDIVFTRRKAAIFIDGCYWHNCPEHGTRPRTNPDYWREKFARNERRDRLVDVSLTEAGWRVIRIWEHERPLEAAGRIAVAIGLGVT